MQLYEHNSDDEDSSIKVYVSDGMQVLQDVCGDIAGTGATDSNYEDNVCVLFMLLRIVLALPCLFQTSFLHLMSRRFL